jgi:hypothetical protein
MELPYLKNKKKRGGGFTSDDLERTPDEIGDEHMMKLVAIELMDALGRKDHKAIHESVKAFHNIVKGRNYAGHQA